MATVMDIRTLRARKYYRERARGGVGLIIVEGTSIDRFSSLEFVKALSLLSKTVHKEGSGIIIQLFQGSELQNGEMVAPSATEVSREATEKEIEKIVEKFAISSFLAQKAGFDGVEIHGAHTYFLNQFFSPILNHRGDRFGGSLEKRMNFGLGCLRAIRKRVKEEFLVFYRHTAVDWNDRGYTIKDSHLFCSRLEEEGLDVIDISPSSDNSHVHIEYATEIKKVVRIPLIAVGGMEDPEKGEKALSSSKCDLIAIGRGLIADPYWPIKVKERREDKIIRCIKCNQKCYGNLRKDIPISCSQNRNAGFE
jgi:2,4-dienoyl-CoA reductase-like NADH-dependent reductase (Old Yellow Enzyme family)